MLSLLSSPWRLGATEECSLINSDFDACFEVAEMRLYSWLDYFESISNLDWVATLA